MKTCPKCDKKHGTRKKVCECGHRFAKKIVPVEPGGWAYDAKVPQPEPLPKGKLSVELIKEQIIYEGLGFCVFELIEPSRIKDAKLKKLWQKARIDLQQIVEHVYAH